MTTIVKLVIKWGKLEFSEPDSACRNMHEYVMTLYLGKEGPRLARLGTLALKPFVYNLHGLNATRLCVQHASQMCVSVMRLFLRKKVPSFARSVFCHFLVQPCLDIYCGQHLYMRTPKPGTNPKTPQFQKKTQTYTPVASLCLSLLVLSVARNGIYEKLKSPGQASIPTKSLTT
eukprot:2067382-Amphidinium_carterae.1